MLDTEFLVQGSKCEVHKVYEHVYSSDKFMVICTNPISWVATFITKKSETSYFTV